MASALCIFKINPQSASSRIESPLLMLSVGRAATLPSSVKVQPLILTREPNNTCNPKLWLLAPSDTYTITLENYAHSAGGGLHANLAESTCGAGGNRQTWTCRAHSSGSASAPACWFHFHLLHHLNTNPSCLITAARGEEIVFCSPGVRNKPSVTQQIILPTLSAPLRGRKHPPVVRRGGKVTPPAVCSGQQVHFNPLFVLWSSGRFQDQNLVIVPGGSCEPSAASVSGQ